VKVVRGEILRAYRAAGGPEVLGYPTADEKATPDGRGYVTSFQEGTIYWSYRTGARVLSPELEAAYLARGGPAGFLGFPVSDTVVTGDQQRAEFEHGTLSIP
jgi:uncharacterized protein with LGFP repeats